MTDTGGLVMFLIELVVCWLLLHLPFFGSRELKDSCTICEKIVGNKQYGGVDSIFL